MRAASHQTLAVYASVGLGLQPQLPSASPHTPTSSVVWALSCRSKQKRGCLVTLSASPAFCTVGSLWVGENLGVI